MSVWQIFIISLSFEVTINLNAHLHMDQADTIPLL